MCGIVGFIDKKNKLSFSEREKLLQKMIQVIEHRGREKRGFFIDGKVALGHTRLSIIDLSDRGAQPFVNKEKNLILSFNGEIYNYKELDAHLRKKYKYKTTCDTETLFYSYQEWGEGCLSRLRGMFAFSFFDKEKDTVFLAGDRFSIKPLYYLDNDDWFAWCSEAKSLLLLPGIRISLRQDKLSEYFLFRSVAGEDTLFGEIKRLLPAQSLIYHNDIGKLNRKYYWGFPVPSVSNSKKTETDYEEEFLCKIKESVAEHLISDAPLGFQLSGGVDSSLVTYLAKKMSSAEKYIHSFSIGLADAGWNEFVFSRQAAVLCGTTHHELVFTEKEFCENLPILTYHLDEPINHPHTVPIYLLSKFARGYVKVLLSGEGCDEVFGGYHRYLTLPEDKLPEDQTLIILSSFGKEIETEMVLNTELNSNFDYRKEVLRDVRSESMVRKISWLDLKTYLPPLLLRQDKMGMAANLEGRVPFLDYRLVEFGLSLPDKLKFFDGQTKILVKKVAEKFLPNDLVYRPKCGFGLPIGKWLKNTDGLGRFLNMFLHPQYCRSFLNYDSICQLAKEHISGREDHTGILWMLINLEIWLKIFFDKDDPKKIWNSLGHS